MIRPAGVEDIPTIASMGKAFFDEAAWSDVVEYVSEDCAASLLAMIEGEHGIVLVAEEAGQIVGMAGGVVCPLYFNRAHLSGQELFLWVKPGERRGLGGRLLIALEQAAKDAGCQSWSMIALDRVEPEATGKLYERRGYRASEHSYIKRL